MSSRALGPTARAGLGCAPRRMGPVEKYLLLISLTVAFAPLAQRLQVAEPVTFVIGGPLTKLIPVSRWANWIRTWASCG